MNFNGKILNTVEKKNNPFTPPPEHAPGSNNLPASRLSCISSSGSMDSSSVRSGTGEESPIKFVLLQGYIHCAFRLFPNHLLD